MTTQNWRPSATLRTLKARADLFGAVRAFFHARGVMEVDVPALSRHGTVDVHIDSFRVRGAGYLHTSPEFGMKRLLAAGSGPIYQLSHVFRGGGELGAQHNPEFTMLEWYRPGWDHHRLMGEVEELVRAVVPGVPAFGRRSHAEAFREHCGVDPHRDTPARLREVALAKGCPPHRTGERNDWLDALMGLVVGPKLGHGAPLLLYDFPATQAALARIRPAAGDEPSVAERFELFWQGVEIANGFHELLDAAEQRRRFEADRAARKAARRDAPPYDRFLVDALKAGMPACAGVALGIDRLLMLQLGLPALAQALPFDYGRA